MHHLRLSLSLLLLSLWPASAAKIAAVGNSITYGYGIDSWTQSYPTRLDQLLDSLKGPGVDTVANFGVSGSTLLKSGDKPYWNQYQFAPALNFAPDQVLIELGTNDSKPYNWGNANISNPSQFIADYVNLIDTFQNLKSHPRIWIMLAPWSNKVDWGILDSVIVHHVNPAILEAGLAKGVNVIDLHSTLKGMDLFLSDSVHPNVEGALRLSRIVHEHMVQDTLAITQNCQELLAPTGFSYQWYKDGKFLQGSSSRSLSPDGAGSYQVSVKISDSSESRLVSAPYNFVPVDTLCQATASLPYVQASLLASLQGNNLHVAISRAGLYAVEIYDMQGHLLKRTPYSLSAGSHSIILPKMQGLRLVRLSGVGEKQAWLYRATP